MFLAHEIRFFISFLEFYNSWENYECVPNENTEQHAISWVMTSFRVDISLVPICLAYWTLKCLFFKQILDSK